MKNPFKRFFKKKEEPNTLKGFLGGSIFSDGKPTHDIIVDTDVAFREPPSKKIAEIRKLFEPVKFEELEFEEEIADFALDLISKESKRKIIEIIKEDIKARGTDRVKHTKPTFTAGSIDKDGIGYQTSFVINKDAEAELYRKKVQKQVKGKSEAEIIHYFEDSIKKTEEHIEKAKTSCPQEPGPKQYEWLQKQVAESMEARTKADLELEHYYLMKQIYNQTEELSPEMQSYLENCYKKENKNE